MATKRSHTRRNVLIVIAVVVVIAIVGVLFAVRSSSRSAGAESQLTAVVSRGTVSSNVSASGSLVDQYTYSIAPGVPAVLTERDGVAANGATSASSTSSTSASSGGASSSGYQTTALSVAPGDLVTAGEQIATAAAVSSASSDLASAVTNAEAALSNANSALSYDRGSYNDLVASGTATTQALNTAKKQMSADNLAIVTAKTALTDAQNVVAGQAVPVISPVAGYVLAVPTAVGASASQVATIGAGSRDISVMVSEYDVPKLQAGQAVEVTMGASEEPFAGVIQSIASSPSNATGVEQYQVIVTSTEIPASSRIGMSATVAIAIASKKDVLNVPVSAVSTVGGKTVVTVIDDRGKQVVTTVKVGLLGNGSVEIISGLKKGDKVVAGTAGTVPASTTGGGIGGRL
ncbi:hypothetical protein BH09ACT1_BH09ACT1_09170 [soil metagenome]